MGIVRKESMVEINTPLEDSASSPPYCAHRRVVLVAQGRAAVRTMI